MRITKGNIMTHLTPQEIMETLVNSGINKTNSSLKKLIILGIMAGAYIAFAGAASTMASYNLLSSSDYYGLGRVVSGMVFTGGLIIVTLAGAELFTGNSLITLTLAERKTTLTKMLRNWVVVYIANLAGSILIAWLVYNSGILGASQGLLGGITVKIAAGKVNMTFMQCIASGILCNWLVCLAVWCATGSKSTAGKIFAVFFPICMFATCGFEHSVANMYFIPAGLFASANEAFVSMSGVSGEVMANLSWGSMFADNLLPVTIGNLIGGILFVAMGYWLALKDKK